MAVTPKGRTAAETELVRVAESELVNLQLFQLLV